MVIAVNKRSPDGRHGGLSIKGNGKLANLFPQATSPDKILKGIDIM